MDQGSRELGRRASAHVVALAFGATYLTATVAGAGPGDALLRGCTAAGVAMVVGALLCQPVVDVVLDAIARDEARRRAQQQEDEA